MSRKSVSARIAALAALVVIILFEGGISSLLAQYKVGQLVPDFTIYNRRRWTNWAGRVFRAGVPMKLSDFSGSVVFMKFFDPS